MQSCSATRCVAAGKSDSTIRAALVPFRSVVRDWAENERVADPIAGVRLFNDERTAITPPTREQVDKAVKAARPDARDAIRVAAATGLRRGELFALRRRDIDFDQNLIYVCVELRWSDHRDDEDDGGPSGGAALCVDPTAPT